MFLNWKFSLNMIYSPVLAVYFLSELHIQGEVSRASPASVRPHPHAQVRTGARGPGWRASPPVSPVPELRPLTPRGPGDAVSAEAGGWVWGLKAAGLHAALRGPLDAPVRERKRDPELPGPRLLLPASGLISSPRSVSSGCRWSPRGWWSGVLSSSPPAAEPSSFEVVRPPH